MTTDEAVELAARALHGRRCERIGGVPFDQLAQARAADAARRRPRCAAGGWGRVTLRLIILTAATVLAPPAAAQAITLSSTSYSRCSSGSIMADGTPVRLGSVASNRHPLGTRITLTRPVLGRRRFTVRDRIGYGTELDIWSPSCAFSVAYGRRIVTYRLGWTVVRRAGIVRRSPWRGLGQSHERPSRHA